MAKGLLRAVGEEIRVRRIARDMSQDTLAAHAGLSRNYLGLIERGQQNSSLLALESLANTLGVSLGELISRAERRRR